MRPDTPRSPDNASSESAPTEPTSARAGQASAPGAEPLLAGTLALMTSYSQPCCEEHRAMILQKIIENLGRLATHPAASSSFQTVASNLRVLWVKELDAVRSTPTAPPPQAAETAPAQRPWPAKAARGSELWHITPETVQ